MFRRSAEDEAERAKKKKDKEAQRAEKRAALQAQFEAHQAKKQDAREAKAAARAEMLAGSRFASTPCYDSLWTYAVVFPDRVEERKKDNSVAKVAEYGVPLAPFPGQSDDSTAGRRHE